MENLGKDISGIVVVGLNLKTVLNLRATYKKLNSMILRYNKYWFLQYFQMDPFNIFRNKKYIEHTYQQEYVQTNGVVVNLINIGCFVNNCEHDDINNLTYKHPNYKNWKKQAKILGYIKELVEKREILFKDMFESNI